ncbi:SUF system Fe-S cluster assembly protein [Acidisoma silvae]|uniref:SUF system Fe-S cluster assembly protein n=2 Tax=Acidisoma silvae TaxID=2802396 RepID=A0A964DYG3_9PROT|nr:SUF system Fe-S cluster assembly protein [Acidisoma silvae]
MPEQESKMDELSQKPDATDDQAVHHAWTPDGEVAPPVSDSVSEDSVIEAIATVYDPEIPVNIYELGLIYAVDIADDGKIKVEMTLTAPGCPSAQELPVMVREAIMVVPGVTACDVETVWDPPWDMSRMSDEARLAMNMF